MPRNIWLSESMPGTARPEQVYTDAKTRKPSSCFFYLIDFSSYLRFNNLPKRSFQTVSILKYMAAVMERPAELNPSSHLSLCLYVSRRGTDMRGVDRRTQEVRQRAGTTAYKNENERHKMREVRNVFPLTTSRPLTVRVFSWGMCHGLTRSHASLHFAHNTSAHVKRMMGMTSQMPYCDWRYNTCLQTRDASLDTDIVVCVFY